MPESPRASIDLKKIGHGVMFEGMKGFLIADFTSRMLIPASDDSDMTYYKRRSSSDVIPPMGGAGAKRAAVFQREWIDACKGNLKTSCDFVYSGDLIEQMLLGLVAYRVGRKLEYNGATGRITNVAEANQLLKRKYRPGWTLNG